MVALRRLLILHHARWLKHKDDQSTPNEPLQKFTFFFNRGGGRGARGGFYNLTCFLIGKVKIGVHSSCRLTFQKLSNIFRSLYQTDGEKYPQCTATTKAGDRCRRTTCRYASFCAIHKSYRAAQSNIPNAGRGAFAAHELKKGGTIGSCIIATKRQNEAEFLKSHPSGKATHSAKVKGEFFTALGAGDRRNNAIEMLNTAGSGGRNNARLLASGRVVTTRNVKKDDELLLAYGSSYRI